MFQDISGVVLAGGKSRRMGTDKRLVSVHGKSLLDRVLSVFLDLFPEVLLVLAEEDLRKPDGRIEMVTDIVPGCAAMGGVYTGLWYARHPRIFVAACDMPFLSPDVVAHFVKTAPEADLVLAQLEHGLQPLHAVYSKKCASFLRDMMDAQDLRLQHLADQRGLNVRRLPESEMKTLSPRLLPFLNLNSPDDVEFAHTILPVPRACLSTIHPNGNMS